MARFKKVFFVLLFPLLLLGCKSSKNGWEDQIGKIKILSTTAQIGDLVREIGGDRINSHVLIQGDLDPHSYEIVKGDHETFENADWIFYNGLGLEHGASLSSMLTNSSKATAIGEEIRLSHPEKILMSGSVADPHIWMDISLWQQAIAPIVQHLSAIDPEGAPLYQERGILLTQKMESAHAEIFAELQKIPSEKRYLVTSHDAFHYFTRSYLADPQESRWEERFAAPEGLAPEGQLNPRDIQKILDYVKVKKVFVVFPESNVNKDSIRKIAAAGRGHGLEIKICSEPLYGDAMGRFTYLEMMRQNSQTIAKYL